VNCQALHTVFCVKRGFRESQLHLTSTSHVIKITTMEMKQAEGLFNVARVQRGPAPEPTGCPTLATAKAHWCLLWGSVGLEACPRDVKPDPEPLLALTEGLGGAHSNKSEFQQSHLCREDNRPLSTPSSFQITFFQISYLLYSHNRTGTEQHEVPHQIWLCFHCSGNGTHLNSSKLNLESQLLSLPY